MKKKYILTCLLAAAALSVCMTGCNTSGRDRDDSYEEEEDDEDDEEEEEKETKKKKKKKKQDDENTVEDAKPTKAAEPKALPPLSEWSPISLTFENDGLRFVYTSLGEEKELVPEVYFEPEWLEIDSYVLGDTNGDGSLSDDYLLFDKDGDGINEVLFGTEVFGNNISDKFCTYCLYKMDDDGILKLVEGTDYYGSDAFVDYGKLAFTDYGRDADGNMISFVKHPDLIEGEFRTEDMNYISAEWSEDLTVAKMTVSFYRQDTFRGNGVMDGNKLVFRGISDASEDEYEFVAEFSLKGDRYELDVIHSPSPFIGNGAVFSGFFSEYPKEEPKQEIIINPRDLANFDMITPTQVNITDAYSGEMYVFGYGTIVNPDLPNYEDGDKAMDWLDHYLNDDSEIPNGFAMGDVWSIIINPYNNNIIEVKSIGWWD